MPPKSSKSSKRHCYLPPNGFPENPKLSHAQKEKRCLNASELDNQLLNEFMGDGARHPNIEKIFQLLDQGADPNAYTRYQNCSFFSAIKVGGDAIPGRPRELKNISQEQMKEKIAANELRRNLCIQLLRKFVDKGANPNLLHPCLWTPLQVAVQSHCQLEIFQTLVELGTDPNLINPETGERAIHLLSMTGDRWRDGVKVLEFLIRDAGADPNVCDRKFKAPLHWATGERFISMAIVECLLKNGADPLVEDKDGKTPRDLAQAYLDHLISVYGEKGFDPEFIAELRQTIKILQDAEVNWRMRKCDNNGQEEEKKSVSKAQKAAAEAEKKGKKETKGIGATKKKN